LNAAADGDRFARVSISTTAAIELFIGLAFFFFLLSLVASSINEGVAQVFNLRAKTLEKGIRNLLDDPETTASTAAKWWERLTGRKPAAAPNADRFYEHARVRALQKPQRLFRRDRKPSYIPSRAFVLTVLDLFGDAG
jgi:hypothetical protein